MIANLPEMYLQGSFDGEFAGSEFTITKLQQIGTLSVRADFGA